MKHPARWLIALALLACALAWWWNAPPREPVFLGQPLSQWMRNNYSAHCLGLGPACRQLRAVGNPAIQWLIYTSEHGRKGDRNEFYGFLAQFRRRDITSHGPAGYDEQLFAMLLLGRIGPMAKSAIPTLLHNLHSDSYGRVTAAAEALHVMGPETWPVVEDQLAHGSNLARCALLATMWARFFPGHKEFMEDDVTKVVDLLAQALRDPEPNIRRNAASTLDNINDLVDIPGPTLDRAAAALWPLDDESNKEVRTAKNMARWYYRDKIDESIPRLTALLADPDEAKRNFARAILAEIEPDSNKAEAP